MEPPARKQLTEKGDGKVRDLAILIAEHGEQRKKREVPRKGGLSERVRKS